MGVIPCYRADCDNIMCDRRGSEGNLCWECFDELVQRGPDVNIQDFMDTPRRPQEDKIDSYEYWNARFPLWDDRQQKGPGRLI